MARLPNYICITCGRGFTTASSGRRHVANVESGKGYITTEAEYRAQLLTGKISAPVPEARRQFTQFRKKDGQGKWEELFVFEFIRGYHNRMGQMAYERHAKNHPDGQEIDYFKNLMLKVIEIEEMRYSRAPEPSTAKRPSFRQIAEEMKRSKATESAQSAGEEKK